MKDPNLKRARNESGKEALVNAAFHGRYIDQSIDTSLTPEPVESRILHFAKPPFRMTLSGRASRSRSLTVVLTEALETPIVPPIGRLMSLGLATIERTVNQKVKAFACYG